MLHIFAVLSILSQYLIVWTRAHVAAWHEGMYCLNGTTPGVDNQNTNAAAVPLYKMKKSDWWFHHFDKCDEFPPAPGKYLDLPSNGHFTVELAGNRAHTTTAYHGKYVGTFPDGKDHPGLGQTMDGKLSKHACISSPNLHTQNESMASGTAFAIAYESDIKKVTPENLVIFTVRKNTPWKTLTTYDVPNLPPCPSEGCTCAWGWVANGCGIPNMYMAGYRCRVIGTPGDRPVAPGVPPVWCEGEPNKCVKGAKQMIFWHQLEGNNVEVDGYDRAGMPKSPTYNDKMGFHDGAQHDIFLPNRLVTKRR